MPLAAALPNALPRCGPPPWLYVARSIAKQLHHALNATLSACADDGRARAVVGGPVGSRKYPRRQALGHPHSASAEHRNRAQCASTLRSAPTTLGLSIASHSLAISHNSVAHLWTVVRTQCVDSAISCHHARLVLASAIRSCSVERVTAGGKSLEPKFPSSIARPRVKG